MSGTGPGRALRVVMTASAGSLPGLAEALAQRGASLTERPLISFLPPGDWTVFDQALERLACYAGVAVTSPRAARALAERLAGRACRVPVWVPGEASAAPLAGACDTVHVAPASEAEGAAEAVAGAMIAAGVGSPVLFPCGTLRRDALRSRLEQAGVSVDPVVCYRTVLAPPDEARAACLAGEVLLVASPSVAQLLAVACDPDRHPQLLAIGPTTAAACDEAGWPAAAVAGVPTVEGVLEAFRHWSPEPA